jgi:hypothetical protein
MVIVFLSSVISKLIPSSAAAAPAARFAEPVGPLIVATTSKKLYEAMVYHS